jgi:hypothetical protein
MEGDEAILSVKFTQIYLRGENYSQFQSATEKVAYIFNVTRYTKIFNTPPKENSRRGFNW